MYSYIVRCYIVIASFRFSSIARRSLCVATGGARAILSGDLAYSPRPERGKMDFRYEVVRLWEIPLPICSRLMWAFCRWPCWESCHPELIWKPGWRQ